MPAGIILPAKVFSNARLDFQNNKKWRFYGKSAKIWCFALKISLSLLYFSKKFARQDHFLQFFAQLMKRLGTADLDCLEKSWLSWFIHIILMQISTWPSLDLKSLDFKNLDWETQIFDLNTMDYLNKFQKLVLTLRWISILIGLDCRDPQPSLQALYWELSISYNTTEMDLVKPFKVYLRGIICYQSLKKEFF